MRCEYRLKSQHTLHINPFTSFHLHALVLTLARPAAASSGFLVTAERVVINSISAGSVIVDFSIVPDSNGVPLQSSSLAAAFSAPVSMGVLGVTTSSVITPAVVTTKQAPYVASSLPHGPIDTVAPHRVP